MLGDSSQRPIDYSTPNTRYKVNNLGTWSSIKDVDNFLSKCNHDTGYYGASIGSIITIKDGTYNKDWVIAGFDCEKNHKASDGNIKDNGYGICLIPKTSLGHAQWDSSRESEAKGYYDSDINTYTLPEVATNLKKVLGNHLVQRNVLLSNAVDSNHHAKDYAWTTAYCTLMSIGQVTGTFASNRNKYDDGEANYKLPLFNYETWSFNETAWLRGLCGDSIHGTNYIVYCLTVNGNSGYNSSGNWSDNNGLRPLIYIR